MSATGSMVFSGSGNTAAYINISASGSMQFGGQGRWSSFNSMSATAAMVFAGSPRLSLIGRPLVFYAVPERTIFNGLPERLTFTASARNYLFRGMR